MINIPTELQEHIALAQWLNLKKIRFYHPANGGVRSPKEGAKFKAMGTSPGIPDICIPIPIYPYHGLYIELKRIRKSRISPAQQGWIDFLNNEGYLAKVCLGFDNAKYVIDKYLDKHY